VRVLSCVLVSARENSSRKTQGAGSVAVLPRGLIRFGAVVDVVEPKTRGSRALTPSSWSAAGPPPGWRSTGSSSLRCP
jgi:hypothetical protein